MSHVGKIWITFCAIWVLAIAGLAALAPQVAPYPFDEQYIEQRLQTPSIDHWFGTDTLGRDIYTRIIYGARVSLTIGFGTTLFALLFGTLAGAIAGFVGGPVDRAIMRVVDFFFMLPSLLLAILVTLLVGRGLWGILLAISLTSWGSHARLVRSLVLRARAIPFVEAARAIGTPQPTIVWRHILPNLWTPMIISLSAQIPSNILAESFLSFIGLGIQPPHASWGTLGADGFRAMKSYPHLILFPGGVLFVTLLALNLLGDALAERSDPVLGRG